MQPWCSVAQGLGFVGDEWLEVKSTHIPFPSYGAEVLALLYVSLASRAAGTVMLQKVYIRWPSFSELPVSLCTGTIFKC